MCSFFVRSQFNSNLIFPSHLIWVLVPNLAIQRGLAECGFRGTILFSKLKWNDWIVLKVLSDLYVCLV